MKTLEDLEKKINSELTTKINKSEIKYNQLYIETDKDDLIDITLFIKVNAIIVFNQIKVPVSILKQVDYNPITKEIKLQ